MNGPMDAANSDAAHALTPTLLDSCAATEVDSDSGEEISPKRPRLEESDHGGSAPRKWNWQPGQASAKIFDVMFDATPMTPDRPVFNELLDESPRSPQCDVSPPVLKARCDSDARTAASNAPGPECSAAWFRQLYDESGERKFVRASEEEEMKLCSALGEALRRTRVRINSVQASESNMLLAFCDALGTEDIRSLRCVPVDGRTAARLPETLRGDWRISANRLPIRRELAGHALQRIVGAVKDILQQSRGRLKFKIGITSSALTRFTHYEEEGYTSMHLLHAAWTHDAISMVEATLIKEFKTCPGCKNIAPGGEGPKGRAPYFAYCVVARG